MPSTLATAVHLPPKIACAVFTLMLAGPSAAQISFETLPDFPAGPGGSLILSLTDLSADGRVVVGYGKPSFDDTVAFRWTEEEGIVILGDLSGGLVNGRATGVSADGSVIVGTGTESNAFAGPTQAFRWTVGTGIVGIGSLGVLGVDSSWASGVSGDGSIVIGQSNRNSATAAFMWSQATGMVEIPPGPDTRTIRRPNAISTDGTAIVGSGPTSVSETEAILRTSDGVILGLGDFPNAGFHSEALGASSDGSVVVGHGQSVASTPNSSEAFVWNQEDGLIGLGGEVVNNRITSLAVDVSGDGRIVIGNTITSRFPGGVWEAFVWDEVNGRRTLQEHLSSHGIDLTNWVLQAVAISDDGRTVVGWGRNPQGVDQAWIAGIRAAPAVPGLQWPGLVALLAALFAAFLPRSSSRPFPFADPTMSMHEQRTRIH